MKAAQLLDYGPAENFRIVDIPPPEPGRGEVLIEVAYAGLRWGDVMSRRGLPVRLATPPFVPGQELTGTVVAVGEGARGFAEGDRVVAQPTHGGYAQLAAVHASRVAHVPEGVGLDEMLVYRVNMPTAYLATMEWAKVKDAELVLVHAAAGGVGMLAVQILKRRLLDVTVIGVVGSDDKAALALANGADHVINRTTHDYVAEVGAIAGVKPTGFAPGAPPAGVHVVLNGVGGSTLRTDRRVIRPLGRWVLYGTVAGTEPINVYESSYDSISIFPFSMIPFFGTDEMARAAAFTTDWLERESLVQPTVHPIDDVAAVHDAMEAGTTTGKVVFALVKLVDLTRTLDAADIDRVPAAIRQWAVNIVPRIEPVRPDGEGADVMCQIFACTREDLPDGEGWGDERLQVSSHLGTHVDAPLHYGSTCEGKPARTIEQIDLDELVVDAVVLDVRDGAAPGLGITVDVLRAAVDAVGGIPPGGAALLRTGQERYTVADEGFYDYPGMTRAGTLLLAELGAHILGTDALGWDRPFGVMRKAFLETGDAAEIWDGHFAGRDREVLIVQQLTNLGALPPGPVRVGFFPLRLAGCSAAPARVVAFVDD